MVAFLAPTSKMSRSSIWDYLSLSVMIFMTIASESFSEIAASGCPSYWSFIVSLPLISCKGNAARGLALLLTSRVCPLTTKLLFCGSTGVVIFGESKLAWLPSIFIYQLGSFHWGDLRCRGISLGSSMESYLESFKTMLSFLDNFGVWVEIALA